MQKETLEGDGYVSFLYCGDGSVVVCIHQRLSNGRLYQYFNKAAKICFKNSMRVLQLMYVNQASGNKMEKKKLYFWPCYPNWLEKEMATPLQYSCPENPMDRGAWWATVCGVAKSQT